MRDRSYLAVRLLAIAVAFFAIPALEPAAAGTAQPYAPGQSTGVVAGKIRDESGLPLPGATITVATVDGHVLAVTRTDSKGLFVARGLPLDTVVLEVQLSGFETVRTTVVASSTRGALTIELPMLGFTETVTVTAARSEQALALVPASVGIVSGSVLEQARGVSLVESLRYVPGVAAGDVSGVDDLRISIRGAGVRAPFGSRGVLLMADGVPVTEPDGQTPHFDGQIDLLNAARVEVVKGPASAMYGGAALGGVVNVIPRVPSRRRAFTLRAEGGSYEFGKAYVAGSTPAGPFIVSGTLGYTRLDGFRAHNSLRNWVGTARADWSSASSRLSFSMLGSDARLELPGTLDRARFEQDPSQVRPIVVVNDWRRENRVFRFGGRYERQLGSTQSIEIDSYGQTRDLLHPIFAVIDQDARRYLGHVRHRLSRGRHALTAGVDVDAQWVDDRWFVNVGGQPTFPIRDDANTVTNLGLYVQDDILLRSTITMTAGVRADRIRYDLVDLRLQDGDASDRRTFRRVSPKLGITWAARPGAAVYGNLSTGFEAPTLGEVRLPAGFNDEVRPQTALSAEVGLRGEAGRLSYDIAVYRMVVDDEILPETIDNVTVFRNVAKAGHTGLEMALRLRARRWLTLDGTYAYARFTLDEFGAFSGNRLPGIPPHVGTLRATLTSARGWESFLSLVAASSTFVDDANSERADAYNVISGGIGYRIGRVRFFARGENLLDVRYTSRVQVNDASGFYYYPAPGRHGSAGVEVRW